MINLNLVFRLLKKVFKQVSHVCRHVAKQNIGAVETSGLIGFHGNGLRVFF